MYSLVVFAAIIAASVAKPTDSIVSVNQDSLGNYNLKYTIDDRSKVAFIQPHARAEHVNLLRTAELATPTLIAEPKFELVPQIPAVRSSHFTSVQEEIPVVAEPKLEYQILEVPAVRTAHIPAVTSSHYTTVQKEVPLVVEREVELPAYRILEVPQIQAVRSSHLIQEDSPLVSLPAHSFLRTVPEAHIDRSSHFGY